MIDDLAVTQQVVGRGSALRLDVDPILAFERGEGAALGAPVAMRHPRLDQDGFALPPLLQGASVEGVVDRRAGGVQQRRCKVHSACQSLVVPAGYAGRSQHHRHATRFIPPMRLAFDPVFAKQIAIVRHHENHGLGPASAQRGGDALGGIVDGEERALAGGIEAVGRDSNVGILVCPFRFAGAVRGDVPHHQEERRSGGAAAMASRVRSVMTVVV